MLNPNIGTNMLAVGAKLTATLTMPTGLTFSASGGSIHKANQIHKVSKSGSKNSTSSIKAAAAYGDQLTKPMNVKGFSFPNTDRLFNTRISAIKPPIPEGRTQI